MRGRVIQSSAPIRYAIVERMNVRDSRVHNYPPRWNGAPSQDLLVIRRNHKTGEVSLDPLRWGLIPIGARTRRVAGNRSTPMRDRQDPTFVPGGLSQAAVHPACRWLLRMEGDQGPQGQQPYAIAMKDGSPFGIGGLWENWRDPTSGEWVRTFAIITTDANELVAEIYDRMPLILASRDDTRWLSDEPNPRDLMRPSQPSRCGCGRSPRASTSRRTMIHRSSNRSSYRRREWQV